MDNLAGLLSPETLTTFSSDDLLHISALVSDELRRRAFERGDLDALQARGFEFGFPAPQRVADPVAHEGVLIAPGAKYEKSPLSHRCTFVRVGDHWVWESPNKLSDEIRNLPGSGSSMRSVTLVALNEGDRIDVLTSRTRQGVHELVEVRSFVYRGSSLEMTDSRTVRTSGHR